MAALLILSYAGSTTLKTEAYDRSIMASWIQAVGSVGAILGAIWAVVHQNEAAERGRRDGILGIIEAVHARATEFARALEADDPRLAMMGVYHPEVVASIQRALAGVSAHAIQSKEGVLALFSLQTQYAIVTRAVDAFLDGPRNHPHHAEMMAKLEKNQDLTREQRSAYDSNMDRVLKGNVGVHLRRIEADCKTLIMVLA